MPEDRQGVIWSLVVFAAWILLVYALFFNLHGDDLRDRALSGIVDETPNTTSTPPGENSTTTIPDMWWSSTTTIPTERARFERMDEDLFRAYYGRELEEIAGQGGPGTTGIPPSPTTPQPWEQDVQPTNPQPTNPQPTAPQLIDGRLFHSTEQLFGQYIELPDVDGERVMLPDTFVRVPTRAPLRALTILDMEDLPLYILKDINNTHFIYFGSYMPPFQDVVRELWWNLVEIRNQTDIRRSTLFGEYVQLFTIPQHPTKQFIVTTFLDGRDIWLLQIDMDYYEIPAHQRFIQEKFDLVYGI